MSFLDEDDSVDAPVAITGISCTFPMARTWKDYWSNLVEGKDCITLNERWDVSEAKAKYGGFLPDIDHFDHAYFGLSFAEAANMDPQQRLILEQGCLAMHQAGYSKDDVRGTDVGVFVGICGSDVARFYDTPSTYTATGAAHSIAANRFSYLFGLTGPSFAVDTACSSSLVATDAAIRYINTKQCSKAVVVGVNVLLSDFLTETFTIMNMMAPDGRCKTFDARANGYVRGEGCGALFLEEHDPDKFAWALVAGSAVNQDGATASMTAPSGPRQQDCVANALADADILPSDVTYVECHGTGTPLGDPIEVGALFQSLCQDRHEPLVLGSAKSNIGHTEGAAGVAGLIKLALSLHHKQIPKTLHLTDVNPEITTHTQSNPDIIQFAKETMPWEDPVRYGGVSSFGFGGTNAHVILKSVDNGALTVPGSTIQYTKTFFKPAWGLPGRGTRWRVMWEASTLPASSGAAPASDHLVYDGQDVAELLALYRDAKDRGVRLWLHRRTSDPPTGLRGLMQAVFQEDRGVFGGIVETDEKAFPEAELTQTRTYRVRYEGGVRYVGKLVADEAAAPQETFSFDAARWVLVTGGTGTLGSALAVSLYRRGVRRFVLLSRRSTPSPEFYERVPDATVVVRHTPLADVDAMEALFDEFDVGGVVHAAGRIADTPLDALTAEQVADIAGPKLQGAKVLDACCRGQRQVDFFWLFSSVSSVWGSSQLAAYCLSNAYLDELAEARRANGFPCRAVRFGAFRGSAMTAGHEDLLVRMGVRLLNPDDVLEAFLTDADVYADLDLGPFVRANPTLHDAGFLPTVETGPSRKVAHDLVRQKLKKTLTSMRRQEQEAFVAAQVKGLLETVAGVAVEGDEPLMDAGLDSLTAVEVGLKVNEVTGVELASSVFLDYPTLNKFVPHVLDRVMGSSAGGGEKIVYRTYEDGAKRNEIAVVGIACSFPGGSDTPEGLWDTLAGGVDCICSVPADRWDASFFAQDRTVPGKTYVHEGGFLTRDIQRFDAAFFNITPAEARRMDPQQRLVLETCFQSGFGAGWSRESLMDSSTGVYIGACQYDYFQHVDLDQVGPYTATGMTNSILANRVSYTLGLRGPSMSIDTACSSSLVAIHAARRGLEHMECDRAFAGGVNLLLSPFSYVAASKAGMLSGTGRCHTFDAAADGFIRGEGCGILALKRRVDVAPEEPCWGVLMGSAVNQDGQTATLTAPSGPSQQAVILAALAEAGLQPADIDYVECHGTGTALGDPMELEALQQVFGDNHLVLGAIKASIGHTEGAAGVAGVIKALLCLHHRQVPPNVQLRALNPKIRLGANTVVQHDAVALAREGPVYAGVSSFGFGGTNGHVIVASSPTSAAAVSTSQHAYAPTTFPWKYTPNKNCEGANRNPFASVRVDACTWTQEWSDATTEYLRGHRVGRTSLVPATAYMEMLLPCIQEIHGSETAFEMVDMQFKNVLLLSENPRLRIEYAANANLFTISSQDGTEHARITWRPTEPETLALDVDDVQSRCGETMDGPSFYAAIGNDYRHDFAGIQTIWKGQTEMLVKVAFDPEASTPPQLQACAFGDTGIHAGVLYMNHLLRPFFAQKAGKYRINTMERKPFNTVWSHLVLKDGKAGAYLFNDQLEFICSVEGTETGFGTFEAFGNARRPAMYTHSFEPFTPADPDNDETFERIVLDERWRATVLERVKKHARTPTLLIAPTHATSAVAGFFRTLVTETGASAWKLAFVRGDARNNVVVNRSMPDEYLYDGTYHAETARLTTSAFTNERFIMPERGALSNLGFYPSTRTPLPDNQVEVRVCHVGLNFRDILNVMGLYPGDPGPPGGDFSGIMVNPSKCGRFEAGDRVCGISFGSFRNYNNTNPDLLIKVPHHIPLANAASIPVLTLTVEMAFVELGKLSKGDVVVIHGAAGGVGLYAIQYAKHVGARIIATAGAEFKHEYLRALGGIEVITSSRNSDQFKQDTQEYVGKVAFVLNSLSDGFIDHSVDLLQNGGHFMEIGKRKIWTHAQMHEARPDVHYHTIAVDHMFVEEPVRIQRMLQRVRKNLDTWLTTIPCKSFECSTEPFRYLQQAKHIGKVVVNMKHPNVFGTYLITGGMGAIGKILTRFLLTHGAEHVVLVGRRASGDVTQFGSDRVVYRSCDMTDKDGVLRLVQDINPDHVVHGAGVLQDMGIQNLTMDAWDCVWNPKAQGAWHLHLATQQVPVTSFVTFSSIASLFGTPGQANYAASNAYLDWLVRHRNEMGLPGVSLQWGAWDTGMADEAVQQRARAQGVGIVTETIGVECFETALAPDARGVYTASPFEWDFLSSTLSNPIARNIMQSFTKRVKRNQSSDVLNQLKLLTDSEQQTYIKTKVIENIQESLVGEDAITSESVLEELGLDSLSIVELRNALNKTFGVSIPNAVFMDSKTVGELVNAVQSLVQQALDQEQVQPETVQLTKQQTTYVTGLHARFPEANNLDEFWELLQAGASTIKEHTFPRFADENTKTFHAALLDDVDQFDPDYFNLTKANADALDPQHRLILESVELAVKDSKLTLNNTSTNVYFAIAHHEYGQHGQYGFDTMSSLAHSMLGLRIKNRFGLKGSYKQIDTACSSFLVAMHNAMEDLNQGKCKHAIVAGANLLLRPDSFTGFTRMGVLNPKGEVKSFSEDAAGYARSEGVGALVLTTDNVESYYCKLLASAQTQNGKTDPIFAPDGLAQEELHQRIRQQVPKVDYLEIHGTGTQAGDLIEAFSLANAYGDQCPVLGCCKPIWGHNEVISGLMEFCKALCVLKYQLVPKNRDFENAKLPKEFNYTSEDRTIDAKTAGCQSFGFSGTNAAVVFEQGDKWYDPDCIVEWKKQRCWIENVQNIKNTLLFQKIKNKKKSENKITKPTNKIEKILCNYLKNKIGVEEVSIDSKITESGLDSLDVIELVDFVNSDILKTSKIELSTLFSFVTIKKLASHIQNKENNVEIVEEDSNHVVTLPTNIQLKNKINSTSTNVFFTGGTGFLGAFLLQELLTRTELNIFVLVRSNNALHGMDRIKTNMEKYKLWDINYFERLIAVPGDISKYRFGLNEYMYNYLAENTLYIVHNAAKINYIHPYKAFESANVYGTIEVLRFATHVYDIPIHYTSTIGVYGVLNSKNIKYEGDMERDANFTDLMFGYAQSKWMAEQLMWDAVHRGCKIVIYRPPFITASTDEIPFYHMDDVIPEILKSVFNTGVMFTGPRLMYAMPVDEVARDMVYIMNTYEPYGKAINMVTESTNISRIRHTLKRFGLRTLNISFKEWVSSAKEKTALGSWFEQLDDCNAIHHEIKVDNANFTNLTRSLTHSSQEIVSGKTIQYLINEGHIKQRTPYQNIKDYIRFVFLTIMYVLKVVTFFIEKLLKFMTIKQ